MEESSHLNIGNMSQKRCYQQFCVLIFLAAAWQLTNFRQLTNFIFFQPLVGGGNAVHHPLVQASSGGKMQARFNLTNAIVPKFDTQALKSSPLIPMDCLTPPWMMDQFSFLLSSTGMEDWVCNNRGEKRVTMVMQHVFQKYQDTLSAESHGQQPASRGLMLDVGANTGSYGLLAMRMGLETLFFDLQPTCHILINDAILANRFSHVGRVIPYGVSSSHGSFKMQDHGICDGRFPASAHENKMFDKGETLVQLDTLDAFVHPDQPVELMKVDTEGNEQKVLSGAMPFFQKKLIRNVIVEVTPSTNFWKNAGITQFQVAETFRSVAEYGYTMVSLDDWSVHKSPESIFDYINTATFGQSDMWLTLDEDLLVQIIGNVMSLTP